MTPILSLVGSSNSGKTTLMEKLVRELTAKGLRIATIKHSHHQPELDTPGKDSWRHKQAGAVTSFLIGPQQMMMVADVEEQLNPNLLASRYCDDFDLVLVEGYNTLPGAKIEVLRAARSTTLRCAPEELIALVTDVEEVQMVLPSDVLQTVPRFGLNDDQAVAALILAWLRQEACHG
ncbi:molybdopterin-guanine dinucleotide biosynthesis protein B [Mariprofundus ferrooxydans]|nr:molybdopterin-guanine dinucleotide biosynthesis protein B [Mariprofundus ferrooxydans]